MADNKINVIMFKAIKQLTAPIIKVYDIMLTNMSCRMSLFKQTIVKNDHNFVDSFCLWCYSV